MLSTVSKLFAAVILVAIGAEPALAATSTYTFSGMIGSTEDDALASWEGQSFSGSVTLSDQGTPVTTHTVFDDLIFGGQVAVFTRYALTDVSATVGIAGDSFAVKGVAEVGIENDGAGDQYIAGILDDAPVRNGAGLDNSALLFGLLLGSIDDPFASSDLVLPDLAKFFLRWITLDLYVDDVRQGSAIGSIEEFSVVAAVPLPAGLPLLGAGLGVLGVLGWRKRKHAAV